MRPFLLLFIGGIIGLVGGYWQSQSLAKVYPRVVGEPIDPEQAKALEAARLDADETQSTGALPEGVLPKVEVVDGTDFDFGTMKRGTTRKHAFIFKNTGNAPLELKVLNSTCKCTVGEVKKEYLQPGEEAPVELTWKAEGTSNDFAQTATIGTSDNRQKEVKLTITGKIGTNYILEPESLDLGEFSAKDSFSKRFTLYSMEDTPLTVGAFWGDVTLGEIFTVSSLVRKVEAGSIPEHLDARYVADLALNVNPGMAAGPINGQIRLKIGSDGYPMIVPVVGKCVSDLRIVASNDYDEEKNLLTMGTFDGKTGGESSSFFVSALSDREDLKLEVSQILPTSLATVIQYEIGEPIKAKGKTLFPVKIIIPPGTKPIDRDGSNPQNFAMIFFKANIENSGEISMYLQFTVK
jgi:hypothetical protein